MASSGVNVLRWSALAFGVFYGFSHQRTIRSNQKAAHERHEYEEKQKIINQAKEEYRKHHAPALAPGSVVMDPANPNFDLEKLLMQVSEQKS